MRARSIPTVFLVSVLGALAFIACSSDDPASSTTEPTPDAGDASDPIPFPSLDASKSEDSSFSNTDEPDTSAPDLDAATDATADAEVDAGPPTSSDGIQNGSETDIDCGGTTPTNAPKCAITQLCAIDDDCAVGMCDPTHERCATAGHIYATYYAGNVTTGYTSASTLATDSTSTTTSLAVNGAVSVAIDPKHDILYTASLTDKAIYSVANGSTSNAGATHTITSIAIPTGLAVDGAADRLFVAGDTDATVSIFDAASTVDGATAATRTITAYDGSPYGLAYDAASDRLFVSCLNGHIDVFDHASTAHGTRAATVSRTFLGLALSSGPQQIVYDPIHDELYTAMPNAFQNDKILVFAHASTLTGTVTPTRSIGLGVPAVNGIALDLSRDELYWSSSTWFKIAVIPSAHTADGALDSSAMREFTGVAQYATQLAFDPSRP